MNSLETECRCIDIMLVEDNPVDVLLTKTALRASPIQARLHVAEDGEQALNLLHDRCKKNIGGPCPDLILLDLNLPKKSGKEVLAEIKRDDSLKHLPVVILTTSEADEDILETYKLHANCFITKPVEVDRFTHIIESLQNFWCNVAKLPLSARN
jgi:two-component system, chemotaxis family, response regulator Rcp1